MSPNASSVNWFQAQIQSSTFMIWMFSLLPYRLLIFLPSIDGGKNQEALSGSWKSRRVLQTQVHAGSYFSGHRQRQTVAENPRRPGKRRGTTLLNHFWSLWFWISQLMQFSCMHSYSPPLLFFFVPLFCARHRTRIANIITIELLQRWWTIWSISWWTIFPTARSYWTKGSTTAPWAALRWMPAARAATAVSTDACRR